jgi:hypothetical protein
LIKKVQRKEITKSFVDLIVINTIIPLQFAYAKVRKRNFGGFNSTLKGNIRKNAIIDKFNSFELIQKCL